jgi:arylsulfatase A-like enzyme
VNSSKAWQGENLSGYVSGKNPVATRKEFVIEHLWQVEIIPPSEGIRTDKWKYFRYINDPSHEELYDLSADPLEINNLASDPSFQNQLKLLRVKLEKKINGYLKNKVE